MQTLKASEVRANFYRLIDEAAESHEPIIISGKRSSVTVQGIAIHTGAVNQHYPNP